MTKTSDLHLTFKQRHGYDPLPTQMKREELSSDLRRELWNCFLHTYVENFSYLSYHDHKIRFLKHVLGEYHKITEDAVDTCSANATDFFKSTILKASFKNVLQLLEFVLNAPDFEQNFVNTVHNLFEKHAAAYRIDISEKPYQIHARTSQQESEATMQSMEVLHKIGFDAAITHLKDASEHLRLQQYSDSIVDSISAVESVARSIVSNAKTLGEALAPLENQGIIQHKAFRSALNNLYGYASDEEGLRHALIKFTETNVGQAEALFFYNVCAAFAGYLAGQQRLIKTNKLPIPPETPPPGS